MPTFTPMLNDRRGRGALISWRYDLGFGHIRTHNNEVVRVNHDARLAGLWPEIGEEVTFGYAVCPKFGDLIAVGLALTSPRQAPPPVPRRLGFYG